MRSVVIVDDEPPARRRLTRLLERHADFQVTGEAGSAGAAVAVIEEMRPDLLLLDVQMGDGTGFDVLEKLREEARPVTIFVTAYGHFAVEAFAVRALDYLLKPVSEARFDAAIARARELLGSSGDFLRRFLVRAEGISYFVEAAVVDWLEAAGNYVVLHEGGRTHVVRATMEGLLGRLDPGQFGRVSRSAAVNLARVKGWTAEEVRLGSGESIRASGKYWKKA